MKTLVYDNSIEGLFSCIFYAYEQDEFHLNIVSKQTVQSTFFDELFEITTDLKKANRVKAGITKKVGENLLNEITTVFCSEAENKDTVLFEYLKLLFAFGTKVRLMLNNETVIAYNQLLKQVTYERHRMIGFMRFQETSDGFLYAQYAPDNNVTALLLGHFSNRFANQNFMIHDTKRNVLGVYNANTGAFFTYNLKDELQAITIGADEAFFQRLWQNYYRDTTILERQNTSLMMAHMPRRYHKNLVELKG